MKYTIDRVRERTVLEAGKEKEVIRVWYSCAELDYHGKLDFVKEEFSADEVKKRIEKELSEIEKLHAYSKPEQALK